MPLSSLRSRVAFFTKKPRLSSTASRSGPSTSRAGGNERCFARFKDLHEGVPDPELLQELRSATDYALWATKVTVQALGRAMYTMVVQEHHLWLNLAEMRDAEKVCFLDAPISQAGLFGGVCAVGDSNRVADSL
ncbi:hypothetical protein M9458_036767, partial [Cirrhinus mrigala]